jgi:hypothetical protein
LLPQKTCPHFNTIQIPPRPKKKKKKKKKKKTFLFKFLINIPTDDRLVTIYTYD